MKKLVIAAACTLVASMAMAQAAGDIIVRARAVHLQSANGDNTGLGLTTNNKTLPEVDFTYFITPNIAAELILTVPQSQTIYSNGSEIGSFKHLPPTLSVQYHFTGMPAVRPYVGLGVNYTNISDVQWSPAVTTALHPNLSRNSFGLSAQVGVDVPLTGHWMLNVDVKKVQIGADVLSNDTKVGTFKVDPLLVGVGIGYKF